jgi:argininosuccinate synthase
VSLLRALNKVGGRNGTGIVDMVENRLVGMKSRGVYETPGGALLCRAHEALESLTIDRETLHAKQELSGRFAALVYYGQWFTPLREALSAFVDKTQEPVTGEVRLKLYKGSITVAGITSPNSLYSMELATFEADEVYDQKDAGGFIKLFGLPVETKARLRDRK